ncbi:protein kinase, partial [Thermodesulfobacteriota bacterium]
LSLGRVTTAVPPCGGPMHTRDQSPKDHNLSGEDIVFFMRTPLFDAIPDAAKRQLLAAMKLVRLTAGERLIEQGQEGDEFFLIRNGRCVVNMEKEGVLHLIGRLSQGDIVGEMAILTGEKRNANVDAETDMDLFSISRAAFDKTCEAYPQLRSFLTRLVSDRFSRALLTTDSTVGKYVVEKVTGWGGGSIVYKGCHSTLDMPVAIKMLKHNMAMDTVFTQQFRDEARTIAQLNHENILKVYDVEEMFRTFFIIMEFVEGESLRHLMLSPDRPSLPTMIDFLMQICKGLSHAHEKDIVHRDIKPGNILVQKDNRVKIVDFGLACSAGTKDENIRGTVRYLSPEQIRNRPVDQRTDIYSLGIMAFEMFVGQRPCADEENTEILTWHLKQDIKDPHSLNPNLPPGLGDVVIRATRRDPNARYQTVSQMLHDLEPIGERMGLTGKGKVPEQLNMTGLFLFYRDEHQAVMQKLIKNFGRELEKVGARLRGVNLKGIQD